MLFLPGDVLIMLIFEEQNLSKLAAFSLNSSFSWQ